MPNGHDHIPRDSIIQGLQAYASELPTVGRRRRVRQLANNMRSAAQTSEGGNNRINVFSDLPAVLTSIQRKTRLRREAWYTVTYPLLLICMSFLIASVIWGLIVPFFRELIRDFGIWMPPITRLVLSGSFFRIALCGSLLTVAIGLGLWFNRRLEWLWRFIPGISAYRRDAALARFCQAAATSFQAGYDSSEALRRAGEQSGHRPLGRAADRWASELDAESDASLPVEYPMTATVAYAFHAKPEARQALLASLGRLFEERSLFTLQIVRNICEPLFICIAAIIVGGTVLALFAPLLMIISNLS